MVRADEVLIVPSVLPADFSRLGEELRALEAAGVDRIQWDVMDGNFVPNITVGPDVIASCRKSTTLPFEAHLMILDPDSSVERYVQAGCEIIIVHAETTRHLHRSLVKVSDLGSSAAVAINPSTPIEMIEHVLDLVDMVLVMTVNPGFGGQAYIASMEPKIEALRTMIDKRELDVRIEVDGGISEVTAGGVLAAGADILVAGSALYKHAGGLGAAVESIRHVAKEVLG